MLMKEQNQMKKQKLQQIRIKMKKRKLKEKMDQFLQNLEMLLSQCFKISLHLRQKGNESY